ncbi:hypothetical protein [Arthrobacter cavernae]|uniref:hypothetical protein n=1 Tax=Arthrobacter cavernae TaxID=2817681 RepID=UPI001F6139F4|nr:hypothetical protein [Arthrobacter cavernae]
MGLFLLFLVGGNLFGPGILVAALVYLVGAIVLAVRPRTSRFGAGLLIAIGVWILIGAGICVSYFAQFGSPGG